MIVGDLTWTETVTAGLLNALFTAALVGGVAAIGVKWYEGRTAERLAKADARYEEQLRKAQEQHEEQLQTRQLEYQTRAALRETYASLLAAQRRSREASLNLARASSDEALRSEAIACHGDFVVQYHRLNLDASREMWEDARGLRSVLDAMLKQAKLGNKNGTDDLSETARNARQNLQRSFRIRLGYDPLQDRNPLGMFDKKT